MSTLVLQTSQPWSGSHKEDRRFRLILTQSLLICLLVGAITPYIRIPQPDPELEEELPPRRVRLLAEPRAAVPPPVPVQAAPAAPAAAEPQTVSRPATVAPVVTPRQRAAKAGVLAMTDALAELRGSTPKTGPVTGHTETASSGRQETSQPSMLTANVTRGSQGIDGGVAHQSVLGAAGLPGREDNRPAGSRGGGTLPPGARTSGQPSGKVRSKEEIQEVLDRHKGAMYTLYNRELNKDASLQGKLVMSLTIAPAGRVTRCVILNSELDATSLERQLVSLIKGIDFGNMPGVPEVTTKVPIEFFPR